MTLHSSILACKIPWREELVGQSPKGQKDSDMTEHLGTHIFNPMFTTVPALFPKKAVKVKTNKSKFYMISCSFCLCNSACSLQSLDHVGHTQSQKVGTDNTRNQSLSHSPLSCSLESPQPLQTCLIMPVHVCKLCNPFVQGSELGVLTPLGPPV